MFGMRNYAFSNDRKVNDIVPLTLTLKLAFFDFS